MSLDAAERANLERALEAASAVMCALGAQNGSMYSDQGDRVAPGPGNLFASFAHAWELVEPGDTLLVDALINELGAPDASLP